MSADALLTPVTSLKGVGPALAKTLSQLCRPPRGGLLAVYDENDTHRCRLKDVLFHMPSSVVDRRKTVNLIDAPVDEIVTVIVTIGEHFPSKRSGQPYRIHAQDETGDMQLVFFSARPQYLTSALPSVQKRVISGRIGLHDGVRQITHPDIIAPVEELEKVAKVEPQYPLTHGISQKMLNKVMEQAILQLSQISLPEWADETLIAQRKWPAFVAALATAHRPQSQEEAESSPALKRLAYDELLTHQLALALMREQHHAHAAAVIPPRSKLQQQLTAALPFTLTQGQQQVIAEMEADMQTGLRMMRLLQGDVGSGKTVVALLAMANLVAQGYQCALMVPTEILGRQHTASLQKLVSALHSPLEGESNLPSQIWWGDTEGDCRANARNDVPPIRVGMLNGKMKAAEKREQLARIANGELDIIVGTHALFQEAVQFKKLGLVVIDEQHRFGVNQRIALSEKGDAPHTLLMTATPIPRTLTMTAYGDMDSSLLTEKPANRKPIDTRAIPLPRIDEVIAGIERAIKQGQKVYWICPLVEEKEPDMLGHSFAGDLAAAEERYHVFQQVFGKQGIGVGLVHGKMKPADREPIMADFASSKTQILVATTVVEVGVDVPDATIMVIEHAERFGLAQLHQLRGRVGRSDKQSSCILLYSERTSPIAQRRLGIMRESNDGFYIAEEDLNLRGAGEVLGTKQSGLPDFKFAEPVRDRELVTAARQDAILALQKDPTLTSPRGHALRSALEIFDYDLERLKRNG